MSLPGREGRSGPRGLRGHPGSEGTACRPAATVHEPMISQRNLLWLVPLALLVTFPLWRIPLAAFLTPRGGYDPAYANVDTETHNFTMDKIRVQQIHSGKKSAEIRAENARTGDKPDEYVMTKVDTDVFDQNGAITNITADRGLYNIETKQLTLIDNVVINKTKDKQSLYTDLLYYDDENGRCGARGQPDW